jgi:hypothetical protein
MFYVDDTRTLNQKNDFAEATKEGLMHTSDALQTPFIANRHLCAMTVEGKPVNCPHMKQIVRNKTDESLS